MVQTIYRPLQPLTRPRRPNYLLLIGIVLTCFSYSTTTIILRLLGLAVSNFNVWIKAATAAVFIAAALFHLRDFRQINRAAVPLLIFFVIYSVRIYVDMVLLDIRFSTYPMFYVLSYYFFLTLLPVVVIAVSLRREDMPLLERYILVALTIANLVQIYYVFMGGTIDRAEVFAGRVQIEGDIEGTALLSPLVIGLMGASLSSLALARLAFDRRLPMIKQLLLVALLGIGIVNILFSGSRGPFLGFMVSFLITVILALMPKQGTVARGRWVSAVYLGLPLFIAYMMLQVSNGSIYLFDRFMSFIEERAGGATEARDEIYRIAWDDFLSSPIIGRSFVTSGDQSPHNIILEVLMATGVIGATFFFLSLIFMLIALGRILRGRVGASELYIAMAALPVFLLSLTSGSVHGAPDFWALYMLVTVLGARQAASVRGRMPRPAAPPLR